MNYRFTIGMIISFVSLVNLAFTSQLAAAVEICVHSLGLALFSIAREHQLISFTTNTLLVQLGLIKCEARMRKMIIVCALFRVFAQRYHLQ